MKRATLRSDLDRLFKRKTAAINSIKDLYLVQQAILSELVAHTGHPLATEVARVGKTLPSALRDLGAIGAMRWPEVSVLHYLRAHLFISLIAEVEDLFSASVIEILTAFPRKLRKQAAEPLVASDSATKTEVVLRLAEAETNQLMYAKPADYRERVEELFSAPKGCLDAFWPAFVEAKATRDVGLHAGWESNAVYLRKAGTNARRDRHLFPTPAYFEATLDLASGLVGALHPVALSTFARCVRSLVFEEMWRASALEGVVPFEKVWVIESDEMVRPVGGFRWGWSGSEELLVEFFKFIYIGRQHQPDFPGIYSRWAGETLAIIDEWLNHPFYF